ncbi:MAG: hypothetical protein HKN51_17335 [Saprospiraceae bacterium]|nr:hypothetical protein [Saprospiraceae bacterium]
MILPINFKGFIKADPLDKFDGRTGLFIHMAVTLFFCVLLLYLIDPVLEIVFFKNNFIKVLEVVLFVGIYAPLIYSLRKSSSLLHYLLIFIPLFFCDILLESSCARSVADKALWNYYPGSFLEEINPKALRYFFTVSVDALLFGPVCLWVSRLISTWKEIKPEKKLFNLESHEALFTESRTTDMMSFPPRRYGEELKKDSFIEKFKLDPDFYLLRFIGIGFMIYLSALFMGSLGINSYSEANNYLPQELEELIDQQEEGIRISDSEIISTIEKTENLIIENSLNKLLNGNYKVPGLLSLLQNEMENTPQEKRREVAENIIKDFKSQNLASDINSDLLKQENEVIIKQVKKTLSKSDFDHIALSTAQIIDSASLKKYQAPVINAFNTLEGENLKKHLISLTGVPIWPTFLSDLMTDTYSNPIHGVHTYGKISIMILLIFLAAFNIRIRYYALLCLIGGHVVSTLFSFLFFYKGSGNEFLFASGIVDGVMLLILITFLYRSYTDKGDEFKAIKGFPNSFSLAVVGQNLLFYFLSILFIGYFIFILLSKYLHIAFFEKFHNLYALPEAMLVNTLTYLMTLSIVAYLCAKNRKLRRFLVQTITDPIKISMIVAIVWFSLKNIGTSPFTFAGANAYLLIYIIIGSFILILINVFRKLEYNIDYLLTSLHPAEAATAHAVIESFYGPENVDGFAAVKKIDNYIGNIRGRKRGLINFPFHFLENILSPFLGLRPRFSTMSIEERNLFLKRNILKTPSEVKRSFSPEISNIAGQIGLSIRALCALAHLTSKKGHEHVKYVEPDIRDRFQKFTTNQKPPYSKIAELPKSKDDSKNYHPDEQINSGDIPSFRVQANNQNYKLKQSYDYIIVGSGAGGAVMAYRLAQENGIEPSDILLVERGPRCSHTNDMSDDELSMLAKLYKEGGLQQTKKFDMVLLQGEALGGTTVINNAVCFEMTEATKQVWQEEYGLDLSELQKHYDLVKDEINIHPLDESAINQNVRTKFISGVNAYNQSNNKTSLRLVDHVLVNSRNELGDGLWNLGNKRGRKTSMAETYIPWAEGLGIHVTTETNALRFYSDSEDPNWNKKTAQKILLQIGKRDIKEIQVNKSLIVAGGCLASSHFLMRSNVFKNIGKNLACNYAFPLIFEYDDKINAYDGAQITVAAIENETNAVFETYFNPPGAFSLTLPFNFQTNLEIMENYDQCLSFGILIGSENSGLIQSKADAFSGRAFGFKLEPEERIKIKNSFITLLKIAKKSGAKHAYLPLKPGIKLDMRDDTAFEAFISEFENYTLLQEEIVLSSAHPQGGNMMAGSVEEKKGKRAVDENFKLVDHTNVYVVDASIFPTSLGVNPQWTVMAMSSLASEIIIKNNS